MDIVIIGSGNVAHCFGHLLKLNGHQVKQVISKTESHAQELAEKLNTDFDTKIKNIYRDADVYILAVADDAVTKVASELDLGDRIVVHTAGAINIDVLENSATHFGVLYPLQSIRKEIVGDTKIPLLIEGNTSMALSRIKALGNALSEHVVEMDSEQRKKMHLTAIFCNNFPNYLMMLCKTFCEKEALDYELLFPLLEETASQMKRPLKDTGQTGPAVRGDESTIKKHLSLLKEYPEFYKIYELLSESIQKYYN